MPFPWSRYWRRVAIVLVIALAASFVVMLLVNNGRLSLQSVGVACVDSAVLAIVAAFPLTQRIDHRPRR